MNSLLLLTAISAVLFLFVMKQTKCELFSCSALTLSTFSVSCILLYILSIVWDIYISEKTFTILLSGVITLTVADLLCYKKYKKGLIVNRQTYNTYFTIRYSNLFIISYILATVLYGWEIKQLGNSIGYNDLSAIGEVKASMEELNDNMNPFIKQMYKVVTASSYIHALIFANNYLLAKSTFKKEFKHLIPFLCTIVITLFSGGRLNIFKSMVGLIFIYYMILREKGQWQEKYLHKIIRIGIPLLVGFTLLFSAVGTIVKANAASRGEIETFEYLSYYAGSPIQAFNIKVEDGRKRWSYERFGNYTFSGLYKIVSADRDQRAENIGNGMVYLGGNSDKAGNAMTIFGGLYFDFGLIGMCLVIFIIYYFMGRYYYRNILNTYSSYKRNKKLIIYTYCYVSIIVMAFYDNCFYILLSTTGILTLCVLLLMYWVYFRKLVIIKRIE